MARLLALLLGGMAAGAAQAAGAERGGAVGVVGAALRGHAAVHRHPAAGRPEAVAPPLRQDRRGLGAGCCSLPFALDAGPGRARAAMLVHVLLAEYIPFIVLLAALFTVAGGIYMRGNLHGSPGLNTAIMGIGAVLASFMGTTGASMLLIRPLIRANDNRKHVAHVVVFFIFIVSNAGGSLTPLGDPPLFLGFLKGVDFFWTVRSHLPGDAISRGRAAGRLLRHRRCTGTARKACSAPTPRPTTTPSASRAA
jgi:hypothetical protein